MSTKLGSVTRQALVPPHSGPLDTVLDALERMQFGAITLTVHEGKLVQVDVMERRRFR